MQMVLKVNIQLKLETFLLGLIDKQVETSSGTLFFHMIMEARLYVLKGGRAYKYVQWKNGW